MNPTYYYVEVNGVIVGKVSDENMKTMLHEIRTDMRTWCLQIGNIAHSVLTFLRMAVYVLVALCSVGPLLMAYFDPALMYTLLNEATRSPAAIENVAAQLLNIWAAVCSVSLGLMIATQTTCGFQDYFAIALSRKLRHQLGVPADGDVRWWLASSKMRASP